MTTMRATEKFGVALGGGGSRAFIHLGVLSKLDEAGLHPAYISGSSMGAVLGALYAARPHSRENITRILDYFRRSSLFGGLIRPTTGDNLHRRQGFFGGLARKLATVSVASVVSFRLGLRRLNPVNQAIDELFPGDEARFETLGIPCGSNSLNLTTGELVEHTSGPVAPALKAGVAVGLVFAPHLLGDHQHADAAPVCPVPVRLCRNLGAETVLAVDICAPIDRPHVSSSGFDVVRRILSMQSEALNLQETATADVLLKLDVADVFWGDFSRIDELVERGREATAGILDTIRTKLEAGRKTRAVLANRGA
ncbi:MAG: patatin-like phospholipase family protein [Planctomycetes bacterium]|nr:patatin-like phospholipase family protein [Planctomycetota bacterium]